MKNDQDLIVIGGGIMGLMTAYYASLMGKRVTILEKLTIGNKKATSFSKTRSIRNDYLDPYYSKLAYKSQRLWKSIQNQSNKPFLIKCGCLNLVKKDITPKINQTYALKSYQNLTNLNFKSQKFNKKQMKDRFPQFDVDLGSLDIEAGFLYLPQVTKTILKLLKRNKVKIIENVEVKSVQEKDNKVFIFTNLETFESKKIVISTGIQTKDTIKLIKGCYLKLPISADRPSQCKYLIPPLAKKGLFYPDKLPVFAYLDVGIYGHPEYLGKTKGVKISFYNPPDIKKVNSKIKSVEDFIKICMPSLKDARIIDVKDADQCSYDMVEDKNFIIGQLPRFNYIFIGTGWNGTGYKFAPLVGKILAQLAMKGQTVYDIARFSPERFKKYE